MSYELHDSWDKVSTPANLLYADIPFGTGKTQTGKRGSYRDIAEYETEPFVLEMLNTIPLADDATVIIHCDYRAKWNIKPAIENAGFIFRNEIAWCYHSGGASPKSLPQKWDSLLVFSVSDNFTYNPVRVPYESGNVAGREGFHDEGKMVADWWDIGILSTTSKERTGYPSQKPLKLTSRVVTMFSNEGDVVVDPCCGSGSTLVSAQRLNRYPIGVDSNPDALAITKDRLEKHLTIKGLTEHVESSTI